LRCAWRVLEPETCVVGLREPVDNRVTESASVNASGECKDGVNLS